MRAKSGESNQPVTVRFRLHNVDGKTAAMTESQFLVDIRLRHGPGDSVRLAVEKGEVVLYSGMQDNGQGHATGLYPADGGPQLTRGRVVHPLPVQLEDVDPLGSPRMRQIWQYGNYANQRHTFFNADAVGVVDGVTITDDDGSGPVCDQPPPTIVSLPSETTA